MALLQTVDICTSYAGHPLLDMVNLSLESGQILALLGPSGSGKSTLLRVIAGLERPDHGQIIFNGLDLTYAPPHNRHFGLMFQEFALFPHQNVFDNVAFGLKIKKLPAAEVERRTRETLTLVGLANLSQRGVTELSGGERQRVALARSLCPQPRLLMLDEPLGALDRSLRERLMVDMRRILKEVNVTAILVTHDQSEALAMADMVAVINQGRLQQTARPEDIFLNPINQTVANFLGFQNFITGTVTNDGITTALGTFPLTGVSGRIGETLEVLLRPEGARLLLGSSGVDNSGEIVINGRLTDRLFQGKSYQVGLMTQAGQLYFDLPGYPSPPLPGEVVNLAWRPWVMVFNGD